MEIYNDAIEATTAAERVKFATVYYYRLILREIQGVFAERSGVWSKKSQICSKKSFKQSTQKNWCFRVELVAQFSNIYKFILNALL